MITFILILLSLIQTLKLRGIFFFEIYLGFVAFFNILKIVFRKKSIELRNNGFILNNIIFVVILILSFIANVYNCVEVGNWSLFITLVFSFLVSKYISKVNVQTDKIIEMCILSSIFLFITLIIEKIFNFELTALSGVMIEPNISASYFASLLIILIAYSWINNYFNKSLYIVIIVLGLLFSVTRSSWIALSLAFIIYFIFRILFYKKNTNRSYVNKKGYLKPIIFLASLLIIILIAVSFYNLNELFRYKIQNIFNFSSGTGYFRSYMNKQAINEILNNKFYLRGTSSFGLNFDYSTSLSGLNSTQAYLPNLYLLFFFDLGIIGGSLFILFFIGIFIRALKQIFILKELNLIIVFLGILVLAISYYATNAIWFPQIWILIGIINRKNIY
ncbi:TPA: hypothetical protein I9097_002978 [Clostridium perfringens]|nr:hypothetical protein [Clostridium perfringens]